MADITTEYTEKTPACRQARRSRRLVILPLCSSCFFLRGLCVKPAFEVCIIVQKQNFLEARSLQVMTQIILYNINPTYLICKILSLISALRIVNENQQDLNRSLVAVYIKSVSAFRAERVINAR